MAAQTAKYAQHATLSGTTADSVTFSGGPGYNTVCVTNRDSATTLYFTLSGTTAVSAADETFVVLPLTAKTMAFTGAVVSVVGSGNAYSVEVW